MVSLFGEPRWEGGGFHPDLLFDFVLDPIILLF
jgi:hypothetical protein